MTPLERVVRARFPDAELTGFHGSLLRVQAADTDLVAKPAIDAAAEVERLNALRGAAVPAPAAECLGDHALVMEFVAADSGPPSAWRDIGGYLRKLHETRGESYGWHASNHFGPVDWDSDPPAAAFTQRNEPAASWLDFWRERRLLCHDSHIAPALKGRLESAARRLPEFLPHAPPPALLHGDLWGGNVLTSKRRLAAFIDPACYYGDPEVDLAMLTLFDAPDEAFWQAYGRRGAGWPQRQAAYQLWPALVHLRLFGGPYRSMVERCLGVIGA